MSIVNKCIYVIPNLVFKVHVPFLVSFLVFRVKRKIQRGVNKATPVLRHEFAGALVVGGVMAEGARTPPATP